MEYAARGPLLKVLLLIGRKPFRTERPKELLRLPDGRLAFESALETLHSAVPSASTIYLSFHNKMQLEDFASPLKEFVAKSKTAEDADQNEHDHHHPAFPDLEPIFDEQDEDIGHAAALLAAHSLRPGEKWLTLSCDYPLLPPPALQQLILEYESPITCFVNEIGFAEPLIAIWDSEALATLKRNSKNGRYELKDVVEQAKG